LGFDDATSIPAVQELELTEEDYKENAVTGLRFVKFQNVTTLSVSFCPFVLFKDGCHSTFFCQNAKSL